MHFFKSYIEIYKREGLRVLSRKAFYVLAWKAQGYMQKELFETARSMLIRTGICPEAWRRIPVHYARRQIDNAIIIWLRLDQIKGVWNWGNASNRELGKKWFVMDGGWDLDWRPVEPHPTIEELFVQGRRYQETGQYKKMMKNMHQGRYEASYGCKTPTEVDAYFERLIQAFQHIHEQGYKTQKELGSVKQFDEIKVVIDRSGSPLQGPGGNHRREMARLLGIQAVPVFLYGVHYKWARECMKKHGGTVLEAICKELEALDERRYAARFDRKGF